MSDKHTFTVTFVGTREQASKLALFGDETEYGKAVVVGVGNPFEDADEYRFALEEIVGLDRDDKDRDIAETALTRAHDRLNKHLGR